MSRRGREKLKRLLGGAQNTSGSGPAQDVSGPAQDVSGPAQDVSGPTN